MTSVASETERGIRTLILGATGLGIDGLAVMAEAVGGLAHLRELILELAVTGHLMPQNAEDEPASKLLSRIEAARSNAIARGEIEKPGRTSPIQEGDIPTDPPVGWVWARLAQAALCVQIGPFGSLLHQADYVHGGTPLINPANIWDGAIVPDQKKTVASATLKRLALYRLRAGDVVMGRRGEMGKCAVVLPQQDGWLCGTGSLFVRITEDIDSRFMASWLRSPSIRNALQAASVGSTMSNLNLRILGDLILGLPPLAEQKRIVTKVDQLMALCDDLEAKQNKKRDLAAQSTRSALTALTTAETADALGRAWERICGGLTLLFGDVASLTDLRRTILGLACRGLLTARTVSSDGRSVLDAVERRRKEWIAHHDLRDDSEASRLAKRLEQAEPQAPAASIPPSWAWASLLRSCWRVVDCHNKTAPYQTGGIPLVRTTNIRDGRVLLENTRFVSKETFEFWSRRCRPEQGDVLFTREAPMGECGLVPPGAKLCMGQRMMLLRTFPELVDPGYLLVALREPAFQERMSRAALGSTVKHLRVGDVENLMIPIPPIEEQRQIIAKVETLMALVDDLEAKLRKQEETATRLAESLAAAVAAAAENNDGSLVGDREICHSVID